MGPWVPALHSVEPAPVSHQGRAHLTLAVRQGRSRLTRCQTRPPMVVQRALYPDEALPDMAFVYLANPCGGLFQGDQIDVSIHVTSGAKAHVTTQNATKVYSMPDGFAEQNISLTVAAGGCLEYMPDPVIPFKGGRLKQETTIVVEPGGTLFYWEIITPGRLAMGEAFDYTRLTSRLTVQGPKGYPSYHEAYSLAPADQNPLGLGVLSLEPAGPAPLPASKTFGSMLILADAPDIGPLLNGLGGETRRWDDVKGGVATLPGGDGLAVRVIGDETPSVQAALISSWSIARKRILGKDVPPLRKY